MKNRNLRSMRRTTKPAVFSESEVTHLHRRLRACESETRLTTAEFVQAMDNIYALAQSWRTQAETDHPAANGVLIACADMIEAEVKGLRHARAVRLGLVEDDES